MIDDYNNNISNIFENRSPMSPITPSKRLIKSDSYDEITNKQICIRSSKVLVHDTPTPFMNRKCKTKYLDNENSDGSQQQPIVSSIKIVKRIIPNTPTVNRNNESDYQYEQVSFNDPLTATSTVKKLYDNNLLLLSEEELPGEEVQLQGSLKTNSNKKVSSLFKPKSKQSESINDSNLECDLSIESLQKRQKRRKNPLIARLSEIQSPPKNIEIRIEPPIEEIPYSPLVSRVKKSVENYKNCLTPNIDESKSPYFTGRTPMSFSSKLTTYINQTSFTHITEMNFEKTRQNDIDNNLEHIVQEQNENENNKLKIRNSNKSLSENEIDQILFDGLNINDKTSAFISENRTIHRPNKFGLVDKTNTSKSNRTKSFRSNSVVNKTDGKKVTKIRSSSAANQIIYPSKIKTFYIAPLNLDEKQINSMKKIIKNLNQKYKNRNEDTIKSVFSTNYNTNTTHLIIDFEKAFNGMLKSIDTKSKFLLLLASLRKCYLIRYEWLLHSQVKEKWNEETKYLLESYVGQNLNDLDEEEHYDYDIRLIKFNQNLEQTSHLDIFSQQGNIFILNSNEFQAIENDSILNDTQTSLSDSFNKFKSHDKISDYIYEIITKCNGLITSRVACADLIIAIDKSTDYDSDTENEILKKEAIKFKKTYNDIINQLLKCKIKKKISVISSNWILDCVLDCELKNKKDYEIGYYDGF